MTYPHSAPGIEPHDEDATAAGRHSYPNAALAADAGFPATAEPATSASDGYRPPVPPSGELNPTASYPSAPVWDRSAGGSGSTATGPASISAVPYPVTGAAYATQPPYAAAVGAPSGAAQPPAKRGVLTPVLAAVSVLLLIAIGVLSTLYVTNNNDLKRTIRDRNSTISTRSAELDKARKDLEAATSELAQTKTDLTGSKNQAGELARQKQVISKCFTVLGQASEAAQKGDRATVNRLAGEIEKVCDEADKYID